MLGCNANSTPTEPSLLFQDEIVEVACGECQFAMRGTGCDLAVRHQGNSYFVVGSDIDDHGDAHAANGLCNMVRKAKVSGEIKDAKFHAQRLELVP